MPKFKLKRTNGELIVEGNTKKFIRLLGENRADLSRANLFRADLCGAKGVNKLLATPLYLLLEQVGKIRAYKLVNAVYEGKTYGGIRFKVGKSYTEPECDFDESEDCAAGINLATLDWCLARHEEGDHVLVAEFSKRHKGEDNICIPLASTGKFRVKHCRIVREKSLKELGLEEGRE